MNPFEKLLVALAEAEVRFVTVGGMACAFNGYVRATQDVDILISNEGLHQRGLGEQAGIVGYGLV